MESETNKRNRSESSSVSDNSGTESPGNSAVSNSRKQLEKPLNKKIKTTEKQTTLDGLVKQNIQAKSAKSKPENKNMEKQIEKLLKSVNEMSCTLKSNTETLKSVVKTNELDHKLKGLVSKVQFDQSILSLKEMFKAENEELRSELHDLKIENENLKKRVEMVESEHEIYKQNAQAVMVKSHKLNEKFNALEQHGRLHSIRVYGIDDSKDETASESVDKVVNCFSNKLDIKNISQADIDVAHRLGKFAQGKSRGIICSFVRRMDRDTVLKARRKLKGSNIVIREDLTTMNRSLLSSTASKPEVKRVWSKDGKIMALLSNDVIKRIEHESTFKPTDEDMGYQHTREPRVSVDEQGNTTDDTFKSTERGSTYKFTEIFTTEENMESQYTWEMAGDEQSLHTEDEKTTTVINLHHVRDIDSWVADTKNVYIGRDMTRLHKKLIPSIWGNPFPSYVFGRNLCIEKYKKYIQENNQLLNKIDFLKGKTLGCFCKPKRCHGDVLVAMLHG